GGVNTICRLNGDMAASLTAGGRVFTEDVNVLDANIGAQAHDVGSGDDHGARLNVWLKVLGKELFPTVDKKSNKVAEGLQLTKQVDKDLSSKKWTFGPFFVGRIPVSIKVGASLHGGVELTADGKIKDVCSASEQDLPSLTLKTIFSPWARA